MVLKVEYENHNGEKEFGGDRVVPEEEEKTGTFTAVGTNTGKVIWKKDMPTPMDGGATATAGGLVFTGDQQGILYAFDAKTGKDLWQGDLKLAFGTAPVVYSIEGQEYVLATIGGAALTASEELGEIGARVVAFKLGGKKLPPGPPNSKAELRGPTAGVELGVLPLAYRRFLRASHGPERVSLRGRRLQLRASRRRGRGASWTRRSARPRRG